MRVLDSLRVIKPWLKNLLTTSAFSLNIVLFLSPSLTVCNTYRILISKISATLATTFNITRKLTFMMIPAQEFYLTACRKSKTWSQPSPRTRRKRTAKAAKGRRKRKKKRQKKTQARIVRGRKAGEKEFCLRLWSILILEESNFVWKIENDSYTCIYQCLFLLQWFQLQNGLLNYKHIHSHQVKCVCYIGQYFPKA